MNTIRTLCRDLVHGYTYTRVMNNRGVQGMCIGNRTETFDENKMLIVSAEENRMCNQTKKEWKNKGKNEKNNQEI